MDLGPPKSIVYPTGDRRTDGGESATDRPGSTSEARPTTPESAPSSGAESDAGPPRFGAALRPLRPRIVLGLLLAASLAGRWIVGGRAGAGPAVALEWLVLLGLGAAVGGIGWRLGLFPDRVPDGEACRSFVERRYALIELAGAAGAILGIGAVALRAGPDPAGADPRALVRLGSLSVLLLALLVARVGDATTDRWWRFVALLGGAGALTATAAGHVLSAGGDAIDVAVRVGHLGAVAVWFGGALWHNVVIVGAVRRYPDARETLRAQALAFRRVVAVLLPAVVLSGAAQAATAFGASPAVYLETVPGRLVVGKIAAVAALLLIAATAKG